MVTPADKLNFSLTEEEVKRAIQRTIENPEIISRDNLRVRHENIRFDCLVRGYIGEYAILKWLGENQIILQATNFLAEGNSIDIDFYYKRKNIELKTSLVPDRDVTVDKAISIEDIKLIRRGDEKIEDLRGDIHLQIYYSQMTKAKDNWLTEQEIDLTSKNINYLYDSFHAFEYMTITFFVAWIDKPTLISRINSLPNNILARTWSFPQSSRRFWNCKIRDAKKPIDLIAYLNSLPTPLTVNDLLD